MRKRVIEAGAGLLGLILIGLAVASATLWRADDVLVARATATAGLLVTDPGVLELGGDPVTVRASVPAGARVVLAVGRDTDVAGWVGADKHQQVSGLASWRALRLAAPATSAAPTPAAGTGPAATGGSSAEGATAPAAESTSVASDAATAAATAPAPSASATAPAVRAADPAGSDMWVAQAAGTGSARLVWHAQDGRWSLLVAGIAADGTPVAPTLEMSWPRVVSTPWLVPGVVLGALLLIGALWLLGRDWWRARTGRDGWTSVLTEPVPQVAPAGPAPVLTRRQLRDLQSRSARPPTGSIPAMETLAAVPPARPLPSASADAVSRGAAATVSPAPASAGAPVATPAPTPRSAPAPVETAASAGTAAVRAAPPTATSPARVPAAEPAQPAAPSWTPGGRRARRSAAEPVEDRTGTGSSPPPSSGPDQPGGPHGGRPTWARPTQGSGPSWAGQPTAPTSPQPTTTPGVAPSGQAEPPRPAEPGRPAPAQQWPDPARGRRPGPSRPLRPGGWVPVPDAAAGAAPASGGGRPGGPRRPEVAPTPGRSTHPSWLGGQAEEPARPASADDAGAPPAPKDTASPDTDETLTSRADAWRRAWGLPTEPRTDDDGKEGR